MTQIPLTAAAAGPSLGAADTGARRRKGRCPGRSHRLLTRSAWRPTETRHRGACVLRRRLQCQGVREGQTAGPLSSFCKVSRERRVGGETEGRRRGAAAGPEAEGTGSGGRGRAPNLRAERGCQARATGCEMRPGVSAEVIQSLEN